MHLFQGPNYELPVKIFPWYTRLSILFISSGPGTLAMTKISQPSKQNARALLQEQRKMDGPVLALSLKNMQSKFSRPQHLIDCLIFWKN